MERLTKRTGKHSVQFKGATYRDEERYGQIYKYQMASIICAYEDTGLTPDEVIAIQKENTELKELLKLAFEDIRGIVTGMEECELCKNNDVGENIKYCHKHDFDCKNCEVLQICKCGQCKGTNNWQWQHADKLKELGVE